MYIYNVYVYIYIHTHTYIFFYSQETSFMSFMIKTQHQDSSK